MPETQIKVCRPQMRWMLHETCSLPPQLPPLIGLSNPKTQGPPPPGLLGTGFLATGTSTPTLDSLFQSGCSLEMRLPLRAARRRPPKPPADTIPDKTIRGSHWIPPQSCPNTFAKLYCTQTMESIRYPPLAIVAFEPPPTISYLCFPPPAEHL